MQAFDHQPFRVDFADLRVALRRRVVVGKKDVKNCVASTCQLTTQLQLKGMAAKFIDQYSHACEVSNRSEVNRLCPVLSKLLCLRVTYTPHGQWHEIAN